MPTTSLMSQIRGALFCLLNDGIFSRVFGSLLPNPINTDGFSIELPKDAAPALRSRIFFRIYERPEIILLRKWLPSNLDCVELGGSIGVVSLHALRKLDVAKTFAIVEAFAELASICSRNILSNFPSRRFLNIFQGAIFYGSESAFMSRGEANTSGKISSNSDSGVRINAFSLEKILLMGNIAGNYSLICDIEGAEFQILREDKGALEKCQMMIVEIHGNEEEFCQELSKLGLVFCERKHSTWVFSRK